MSVIEARGISKAYPPHRGKRALFGRGGLNALLARAKPLPPRMVLQDIDLVVEAGESIGLIGRNGSGKSTLLKILGGVTLPTSGRVKVRGHVASLLELGAGFHSMLTGRENVYLNAGLMGVRHRQVDAVFDQILEFSGIAEFIDQPVDTYSSGMYVRLAFSIAVHSNPDVFLVDEVLAVGDEEFQRKCRVKIGELKEQKKTIVFVSHDLGIVGSLCDRVMLLKDGRMVQRATPQETINYYLRQVGLQTGVHAMKNGAHEVLFNQGRLTLYHNGLELTAPAGLTLVVASLGQFHAAAQADWGITGRSSQQCTAVAALPRLPMRLHWQLHVEEDGLSWTIAVEILSPVSVEGIMLQLQWPLAYAQIFLGILEADFPEIGPNQTVWQHVAGPSFSSPATWLLPGTEDNLPPLAVELAAQHDRLQADAFNSDYLSGARVLQYTIPFATSELPLQPGTLAIATLRVRPVDDRKGEDRAALNSALAARLRNEQQAAEQQLRQEMVERTVHLGTAWAYLHGGIIRLYQDGQELTAKVHWHTQLRVQGVWVMSHSLTWEETRREGETLRGRATSPRFPYVEHWTLGLREGRFHLRVEIEALRILEVDEFNVSIGLKPLYTLWQTPHETGEFPPFSETRQEWQHLNQSYLPADWIRAEGSGLSPVTVHAPEEGSGIRMSPINTGSALACRVLQALRTPESPGALFLTPGRHVLMDCSVEIGGVIG